MLMLLYNIKRIVLIHGERCMFQDVPDELRSQRLEIYLFRVNHCVATGKRCFQCKLTKLTSIVLRTPFFPVDHKSLVYIAT